MTITLTCIKPVIMLVSNEIAFIEGHNYQFHVHFDGSVSKMTEKGLHLFRSEIWPQYFQYQLEEEEVL